MKTRISVSLLHLFLFVLIVTGNYTSASEMEAFHQSVTYPDVAECSSGIHKTRPLGVVLSVTITYLVSSWKGAVQILTLLALVRVIFLI